MMVPIKEENIGTEKYFEKVRSSYMFLLGSRDQRTISSLHKAIIAPLPASGFSLALGLAHELCH